MKLIIRNKGSKSSGDFGHQGRPGKVGGSAGGGQFTGKTRYEEWSRKMGYAPKHRSGKLTGKRFSYNGHKYEIIQSIPPQHAKELVHHYGAPVAFIHTFDHTVQKDVSFALLESGTAREGFNVIEDLPIKYSDT